jgi:hypothetical protein
MGMNLRFDPPENGWMRVQVNDVELDVSDVPCDSLFQLTTVLARLLLGSSSEVVEWSLEPEYAKWKFDRSGDALEFRVQETSRSDAVLIERGSTDRVLDQIMTALGMLGSNPCWAQDDSGSRIWSWPFPSAELERLKTTRAEQAGGGQAATRSEST